METPFHLTGKTILITGASSGIGRQIAVTCSRMGAQLVLTGRNSARLAETQAALEGTGHRAIAADLLNDAKTKTLVEQLPALDGVVHCAGLVHSFPIKFLDTEKIEETLQLNFVSVARLTAFISRQKKMNRNASVVFMSSISGQYPHIGGSMYGASKAALETFAKVVALEFSGMGIRANCISPAMVKTPMYDKAQQDMSKEIMDEHVAKYPLGVGQPEDVAYAAVYLLSDAARWISGINLILDGGYLLQIG